MKNSNLIKLHSNQPLTSRNRARRGGILTEALIAAIALGTASTLAVTVMSSVSANRRTAERQLLATQELQNQLERWTATPWSELTSERLKEAKLSATAAAGLPSGELKISLDTVDKPRTGKRLTAELRWQDRNQGWRPPVRLTVWVFEPTGGT